MSSVIYTNVKRSFQPINGLHACCLHMGFLLYVISFLHLRHTDTQFHQSIRAVYTPFFFLPSLPSSLIISQLQYYVCQDFGGFFLITWVLMCVGASPRHDISVVCMTISSVARQPQLHKRAENGRHRPRDHTQSDHRAIHGFTRERLNCH